MVVMVSWRRLSGFFIVLHSCFFCLGMYSGMLHLNKVFPVSSGLLALTNLSIYRNHLKDFAVYLGEAFGS